VAGCGHRSALPGWPRAAASCAGRVDPVAGGRSNLTSVVTDATAGAGRGAPAAALRRARLRARRRARGADHGRARADGCPVPEVLGIGGGRGRHRCAVPRDGARRGHGGARRAAALTLAPRQRARAHARVVTHARAVHAVDVDAVGLGGSRGATATSPASSPAGRGSSRAGRTVRCPSSRSSRAGSGRRLPEQDGVALVHGDFRLDNLIVDVGSGEVRAVLDWELATLGDPLADLGTLLAYWGVPARGDGPPASCCFPTSRPRRRLPRARELVAAYAAARGLDRTTRRAAAPYLAFAWFRIACILEGCACAPRRRLRRVEAAPDGRGSSSCSRARPGARPSGPGGPRAAQGH
jgi:aminoglycoside phosphotransferase (APT) family kinase protein